MQSLLSSCRGVHHDLLSPGRTSRRGVAVVASVPGHTGTGGSPIGAFPYPEPTEAGLIMIWDAWPSKPFPQSSRSCLGGKSTLRLWGTGVSTPSRPQTDLGSTVRAWMVARGRFIEVAARGEPPARRPIRRGHLIFTKLRATVASTTSRRCGGRRCVGNEAWSSSPQTSGSSHA